MRDVLVQRLGAVVDAILVAPGERVRKRLAGQGLMGERRDGVVAAPDDAVRLGGRPVPHLVEAAGGRRDEGLRGDGAAEAAETNPNTLVTDGAFSVGLCVSGSSRIGCVNRSSALRGQGSDIA